VAVVTGIAALAVPMSIVWLIVTHISVFFICGLMCHGELARTRPAPKHLTVFYLCISAGGMTGGIAAALLAPHVFKWVAEYPILIALITLCRPGLTNDRHRHYALFCAIAALAVLIGSVTFRFRLDEPSFVWPFGALLVASVLFWRGLFAAIIAFAVLSIYAATERLPGTFVRSFYGVSMVYDSPNGQFRVLKHGTTLHGVERIRQSNGQPAIGRPELLVYYRNGSGIAQSFDAVRARIGGPVRIAVIGLGAGMLACRSEPDDTFHFYEIDPGVVQIARDQNLFSFLQVCRPNVPIVLGDARLKLAEAPDESFDLIVVDAFSSDAIPIHLLTREAMAVYLKKLRTHGMVVLHLTNGHLELASVAAGVASANGLITRIYDDEDPNYGVSSPYGFPSIVAAVARREEDFGLLAQARDWKLKRPDPSQWIWTDDYSNIFGALLRKLRGRE